MSVLKSMGFAPKIHSAPKIRNLLLNSAIFGILGAKPH
jgi:hypothetical protein